MALQGKENIGILCKTPLASTTFQKKTPQDYQMLRLLFYNIFPSVHTWYIDEIEPEKRHLSDV